MTEILNQLTLAAKACGHLVIGPVERFIVQPNAEHMGGLIVRNDQGGDSAWNPRNSDGDCARMEAQLSVCVEWSEAWVISWHGNVQQTVLFSTHNGDKNAARRAASVAVAAEIGRLK